MDSLKDRLNAETLSKLHAQAKLLKEEEEKRREERKKQAEEARRQEQKRLENDFEYLLNNSKLDWHKFK